MYADTENSVIDAGKCIGCGTCAVACSFRAISVMAKTLTPQQSKAPQVINALRALIQSKAAAEGIAAQLSGVWAASVEKSSRPMAEELRWEEGYMLPQRGNSTSPFVSSQCATRGGPLPVGNYSVP